MNPVGATPAIQSQWTYRPNRGLMVALATMASPTIATAQNRATPHDLGASASSLNRDVLCLPARFAIFNRPVVLLLFQGRRKIRRQLPSFDAECSVPDRLTV
jgi:hypothetical protein